MWDCRFIIFFILTIIFSSRHFRILTLWLVKPFFLKGNFIWSLWKQDKLIDIDGVHNFNFLDHRVWLLLFCHHPDKAVFRLPFKGLRHFARPDNLVRHNRHLRSGTYYLWKDSTYLKIGNVTLIMQNTDTCILAWLTCVFYLATNVRLSSMIITLSRHLQQYF